MKKVRLYGLLLVAVSLLCMQGITCAYTPFEEMPFPFIETALLGSQEGLDDFLLLLKAIRTEDIDALNEIIGSGFDINTANDAGMTPLMLAVQEGSLSITQALLQKGAQINAQDKTGKTALIAAEFSRMAFPA